MNHKDTTDRLAGLQFMDNRINVEDRGRIVENQRYNWIKAVWMWRENRGRRHM